MLCYAPRVPLPSDFDDLQAVRALLDAGKKYGMDAATEYARLAFLLSKFVAAEPFRVYALGCRYAWPDVARAAARETLRLHIYFEYVEELDLIPLRAYHRLSEYRKQCGLVARQAIRLPSWVNQDPRRPRYKPLPWNLCACSSECAVEEHKPVYITPGQCIMKSFVSYLETLRKQFQFLPDAGLACAPGLLKTIKEPLLHCSQCVARIHDRVATFTEEVRSVVEHAISQVVLDAEEDSPDHELPVTHL